jgi:hypothetical protein
MVTGTWLKQIPKEVHITCKFSSHHIPDELSQALLALQEALTQETAVAIEQP